MRCSERMHLTDRIVAAISSTFRSVHGPRTVSGGYSTHGSSNILEWDTRVICEQKSGLVSRSKYAQYSFAANWTHRTSLAAEEW